MTKSTTMTRSMAINIIQTAAMELQNMEIKATRVASTTKRDTDIMERNMALMEKATRR